MQGSRAAPSFSSRLRRERQRRNRILADVVREIDVRLKDSGVTESLVSAWELGKHRTSARYRAVLCEVFNLSPEALFADQDHEAEPSLGRMENRDAGSGTSQERAQLVSEVDQLRAALLNLVCQAEDFLVAVGSRSRDQSYLQAIEQALQDRPRLIHYRILIGPPRRELLKEHLLRLLELRDPDSREHGFQTLHLGLVEDLAHQPERFFVASERSAVVVMPSVNAAENFDSGVVLGHAHDALGLVQHARELYRERNGWNRSRWCRHYRSCARVPPSWSGKGALAHHMDIASSPGSTDEDLADAVTDQESIVALTQQLVQIPSQAGIDPYEPILSYLESWLVEHGLNPRRMHAAKPDGIGVETVALACDLDGGHPGPRYVLDACVDTAPFGDLDAWRHPPTSGVIDSSWLHGRGSADSKVGAAIFAHIATRLRQQLPQLHGSLTLLLDADEHTGQFGGAKRYFAGPDAPGDVAGVMIGYPGLDKVVIGGRGFLRAQVTLYGEADHSGSSRSETNNAVERAAAWVEDLTQRRRPRLPAADKTFGPPPKLTVTAIHGGHGYSTLPDCCTVSIDVRLTPTFDRQAAVDLLEEAAQEFDRRWPAPRPTRLDYLESWPPYRLSKRLPLCAALTEAAASYLPNSPRMKVAGPSNIGNYLAQLGIPATAGFGVVYRGLHGTDESINLESIPVVQAVYQRAVRSLLTGR